MADVFLSYAREDRDAAERLAHALERHGWSVWWDRHVPAGKRFDEVIAENLASARCVVVLWSKAANASEWVGEEAEEARERGLLIPALIEAVEPPLGFRRIQAADLVGWDGSQSQDHAGFRQLLLDMAAVLRSPANAGVGSGRRAARDSRSLKGVPLTPAKCIRGITIAAAAVALAGLAAFFLIDTGSPQRGDTAAPSKSAKTIEAMPVLPAKLDGRWQGRVTYDWGVAYDETFTFRTVGETLTGSASFLNLSRTVLDASLSGQTLRFVTKWREGLGDNEKEVTNRYVGTLDGDALHMVLSIDGGFSNHDHPTAFTLTRSDD